MGWHKRLFSVECQHNSWLSTGVILSALGSAASHGLYPGSVVRCSTASEVGSFLGLRTGMCPLSFSPRRGMSTVQVSLPLFWRRHSRGDSQQPAARPRAGWPGLQDSPKPGHGGGGAGPPLQRLAEVLQRKPPGHQPLVPPT